jgi:RNA polymerase sigma-70 factor (sigma-E family)
LDGEQPVAALEQFLAERGQPLLHTAILLAGSRADGEDLLQSALERLVHRWKKIEGNPEGYVRTTLYNLAVDGWRRKTNWRARLGLIATPDAAPDEASAVDDRDTIIRLLHQLPPRQRTAIVLRYWEDLSEADTAKAMGCSVGTVKTTTHRAMQRLRELSIPVDDPTPQQASAIKLSTLTSDPAGSPA